MVMKKIDFEKNKVFKLMYVMKQLSFVCFGKGVDEVVKLDCCVQCKFDQEQGFVLFVCKFNVVFVEQLKVCVVMYLEGMMGLLLELFVNGFV